MSNLKSRRAFKQHINKWHFYNKFCLNGYRYGIVSKGYKYITKNQMEACRKVISRYIRRIKPRPFVRTQINYSIYMTKKAIGARMGKGKGSVCKTVSKIAPNKVLFMLNNITNSAVQILLTKLETKLPIKLNIVYFFKNGHCRNKNRCIR